MRTIFSLILTIAALLTVAFPATASEFIDMDVCLGKQIIGRVLCKNPSEINYVTRVRDNIYLFSVFYAKNEAFFFVGVYNDQIRVQGKDFQKVTRTIPYNFDKLAKCGVVDYVTSDCSTTERIVCCSQKTMEEQLDDKFWDRPIPELLEEDLRNALQSDNATEPERKDEGMEAESP